MVKFIQTESNNIIRFLKVSELNEQYNILVRISGISIDSRPYRIVNQFEDSSTNRKLLTPTYCI